MAGSISAGRALIRARATQRSDSRRGPATDRLIWDPAGADAELSLACQDVAAGRFAAARDLLVATGKDWDLRCLRTLVLAGAGQDGVAAQAWMQEESGPHALVFLARVRVLQAVAAARRKLPVARELILTAQEACQRAEEWRISQFDPTPCVALLHLASVHPVTEEPPTTDLMGVRGPWHIMRTVWSQHPYNREAHHRMLTAVQTAGGDGAMFVVAHWLAGEAKPGSAMHLLPLAAYLADFRKAMTEAAGNRQNLKINPEQQWTGTRAVQAIESAYTQWLDNRERTGPAVLSDLHLLAHAAYMAGRRLSKGRDRLLLIARDALNEAGPYAWREPWALTASRGDAAAELLYARRVCGAWPPH